MLKCILFNKTKGREKENKDAKAPKWSRKWQPTPVFLLGKFHTHRSLTGSADAVAKRRT